MGIMAYSLLWVVQDFVHQPYKPFLLQDSSLASLRPTIILEPCTELHDALLKDVFPGILSWTPNLTLLVAFNFSFKTLARFAKMVVLIVAAVR